MFRTILLELFLLFRPFKSYMQAKQNGGLLLREKQAQQLSTCSSKLLTAKRCSHRLTIQPWNHGTMEPSNQKSQMDQEYGLLPADARQQKMGCKEWAFQAFMSHTATSSYHVCNEFNHLNLFDHYPWMIYGSAMVWNAGKYSCQANIVFLYTTDICLLEVHCFLEVDMKYLQTRFYETNKSLGAPVFGF